LASNARRIASTAVASVLPTKRNVVAPRRLSDGFTTAWYGIVMTSGLVPNTRSISFTSLPTTHPCRYMLYMAKTPSGLSRAFTSRNACSVNRKLSSRRFVYPEWSARESTRA
jgi:hypothetical protein